MRAQPKEFDWKKVHPWQKKAYDFGMANKGWFAVKAGTKQHAAWEAYSKRIAYTPVMFRAATGDQAWTAPCEWPEWMENTDSARRIAP